MNRAVDRRGSRAGAQQFAQEQVCGHLGMGLVRVLLLGNKSVSGQPLQQLGSVGADHLDLRIVNVGVDKSGGDQRVGILDRNHASRQLSNKLR